ncbi:hypothetical protein LZQ00_12300 [Sphingobacterium sp. SRCM116780]|uniref:RHS repeat-associated core domain-containing protein n=1 Tax=Sphingobacterium sp. SRCM116780 TaxID=2907623 RepID=UPI001F441B45|nr:RHS repeat-associated core domain-containing protein [Sphingobacterium sp. SRCM116780]UIR55060.1 hypothetical protein LZQ00_12300 [Sphingobacterium sp. SRCM116780]
MLDLSGRWKSEHLNQIGSSGSYRFLHKDYLGSILAISSEDGTLLEERHFDAWGNLTHGTMDLLDRGYTSHEHFDEIGIVHMNGRLYDPSLRRFLNADEHIQDIFNTQNYNKYGYVLNNPLMHNDPNGEVFFFAFLAAWGLSALWATVATGAIIGAGIGLASYTLGLAVSGNIGQWSVGGALRATLFGAVSGAVTAGIGELFSTAAQTFGNALLQAGVHGVAQGVLGLVQGANFLSSAAGGLLGSLGAYGWGQMMNGVGLAQFSQSTYGMIGFGALSGGIGAELTGGNFWQGAIVGGVVAGLNHAMHKLAGPGDEKGKGRSAKATNDAQGDKLNWFNEDEDGGLYTVANNDNNVPEGTVRIYAHGNKNLIVGPDGVSIKNAEQFDKALMERSPTWRNYRENGGSIKIELMSCNTGNGFASMISKAFRFSSVMAPNNYYVAITKRNVSWGTVSGRNNLINPGRWYNFVNGQNMTTINLQLGYGK